ncbi:MAG: membrane protein insertion efficiency factor YidD [Chloroflexi bacterium]|nr:membrane protein insertion efficiency factor YidD [Chloroflexota bacterium]
MKHLALFLLKAYSRAVSPYVPGVCKYHPSCYQYSQQAMERYGVGKGVMLTVKRLARCHPGRQGGYDPVP